MKGLTGLMDRTHFRVRRAGISHVGSCGFKAALPDRFTDDPDEADCGNCRRRASFRLAMAKKLRARSGMS